MIKGLALALALLVGAPHLARAAEPSPAVTLVQQAAEAYKAGRYLAAAELFVAAFELSKAPVQLRNAAKAYTKADSYEEATATWSRYLEQPGLTASERAEAGAELRAIEAKQAALRAEAEADAARAAAAAAEARAAKAATAPVAPPPEARVTAPPEPSPPVAAYALVGVGAAAAVTSAVLFFHANARLSDLDRALGTTDGEGKIVGISLEDATSERSGVEAERTASAVLLGAGLAAVAGGVVWWILSDGESAPAEIGVAPRPGGLAAQLSLRF